MRKIKKNVKKICKKGKIVGIFAVAIAFGNRVTRNAVYWRKAPFICAERRFIAQSAVYIVKR